MNAPKTLKAQTIQKFRRYEGHSAYHKNNLDLFRTSVEFYQIEEGTPVDVLLWNSRGSNRCGIFEIQTDEGIFRKESYTKIHADTPRKRAKVLFKTWEQMGAEELANDGDITWTKADSIGQDGISIDEEYSAMIQDVTHLYA